MGKSHIRAGWRRLSSYRWRGTRIGLVTVAGRIGPYLANARRARGVTGGFETRPYIRYRRGATGDFIPGSGGCRGGFQTHPNGPRIHEARP